MPILYNSLTIALPNIFLLLNNLRINSIRQLLTAISFLQITNNTDDNNHQYGAPDNKSNN